jgi:uncharacterized protein (UPF0333 family)
MKKAQVSFEYILLVGMVFFFVVFVLYYTIIESNQTIKMNMANDVVTKLAKTADMVYALGPGSQDYIQIEMPNGVQSTNISNKKISLKIKIFSNVSDVFAETKANVTGTLPTNGGIQHVSVKVLNNYAVQIS